MPSKTILENVVVIRKTKISENDLVFCCMSASSGVINAIGKSARKPGNTFSNRLDLFNVARINVATTKGLWIIREAKLLESRPKIHKSFKLASCAGAVAELAWRLTFSENSNSHLFDFLIKTFSLIENENGRSKEIAIASLIKLLAMEGFCPACSFCANCNKEFDFNQICNKKVSFNELDGGFICDCCAKKKGLLMQDKSVLFAYFFFLNSTYEQILEHDRIDNKTLFSLKKILQSWILHTTAHVNKSLELI